MNNFQYFQKSIIIGSRIKLEYKFTQIVFKYNGCLEKNFFINKDRNIIVNKELEPIKNSLLFRWNYDRSFYKDDVSTLIRHPQFLIKPWHWTTSGKVNASDS